MHLLTTSWKLIWTDVVCDRPYFVHSAKKRALKSAPTVVDSQSTDQVFLRGSQIIAGVGEVETFIA